MDKRGGVGIIVLVLIVIVVLGIGGYFVFFGEKCAEDELFNPYRDVCVGKNVLCNLGGDCTLLEGQSASFPGESFAFRLVLAKEESEGDSATISINGATVDLSNYAESSFAFGNYIIFFESADGDADKIMGASFEVTKI